MTRVLTILGLAAFVVGPLLAHFGIVAPLHGFVIFGFGLLLAVLALVCGIGALAIGPSDRRRKVVPSILLVLLMLLAVTVIVGPAGKSPRINDITTDTENPPQFLNAPMLAENAGRDMSYPGAALAAQQKAGYPDLAPLHLAAPPDEAFARVRATAQKMPGWQLTRVDPADRAIEGIDTSRLFRFRDDFAIEVRRAADGGSVVEMRSKSRDGRGDLGANAARIRRFFTALKAAKA
jgi:uncharacterized protein (DUF1499 family)